MHNKMTQRKMTQIVGQLSYVKRREKVRDSSMHYIMKLIISFIWMAIVFI